MQGSFEDLTAPRVPFTPKRTCVGRQSSGSEAFPPCPWLSSVHRSRTTSGTRHPICSLSTPSLSLPKGYAMGMMASWVPGACKATVPGKPEIIIIHVFTLTCAAHHDCRYILILDLTPRLISFRALNDHRIRLSVDFLFWLKPAGFRVFSSTSLPSFVTETLNI